MNLRDLKLGAKQLLGFGVILLLMASANIFSINRMRDIKAEIDEVTKNRLPRAFAIADLKLNAFDLRVNQLQHAFAIDTFEQKSQAAIVVALIDSITQNLETYKQLKAQAERQGTYLEEEKRLYSALETHWENYQDLSRSFLGLLLRNQKEEALAVLNGEALHVFDEFSAVLSALVQINQEDSFNAAHRVEEAYRDTRRVNLTLLVVTIVVSILFAAGLARLIVVPVRLLASAAETVARGNLSVQLGIRGKDEIGNLARSFNQMTTSLRDARARMEQQAAELQTKHVALQGTMRQLQRTQSQLVQSEKMASLGQLTAGIAHELNNPINFITSNVNPLKRDLADLFAVLTQYDNVVYEHKLEATFAEVEGLKRQLDYAVIVDEIDRLLEGIEEGARRTTEIVRGLRNFSRLDEEGQKLASINQGLEATLLMLKNQLKNRVEVIKDFQDFPDILCYPGKLNQAFLNILANASQAITGAGKIFIKTSYDGEIVTVSIKDTGKGMSNEVKQRIFEPFFTTKDVGEGTGLGLSITYGIIEDHDGNLEVYSEPGKGAEFVITLPAKR
ncbi:MCP four helix bundle domain-containing protein [candidate division KSB1 bacterium]|nr:MCP four helix bundle domain-containing protein [candidate division KSB1 bacterium]